MTTEKEVVVEYERVLLSANFAPSMIVMMTHPGDCSRDKQGLLKNCTQHTKNFGSYIREADSETSVICGKFVLETTFAQNCNLATTLSQYFSILYYRTARAVHFNIYIAPHCVVGVV